MFTVIVLLLGRLDCVYSLGSTFESVARSELGQSVGVISITVLSFNFPGMWSTSGSGK